MTVFVFLLGFVEFVDRVFKIWLSVFEMRLLSFAETKKILDSSRLPLVQTVVTRSAKELFSRFAEMPKPVVLKPSGPEVLHKTERGLVFLNVSEREQLEEAIKKISSSVQGGFEFLMQQQLSGAELIIGGKLDSVFGPVVLFGTGGVYAELLDDVAVRVAPLSENDAREMVWETHAKKFISGFRSMKMSEAKIIDLLLKTGGLLLANPEIKELDFNPVIARDEEAWIVDARIIVDK